MYRILLVDDEKNILEAYRRNLSDEFDILLSDSGYSALELLSNDNTINVIVSDYKMPKMNGVELLEKARLISPETIQIMLTGHAEMESIIELINKGKIFRFLTKPCSREDLVKNIKDAIHQYELITAERELLGKTLGGSIRVLTDLLSLAKPQAFYKTQKIRSLARSIYNEFDLESKWQIEIAATLSQIGCVTIPDDILKKIYKGMLLYETEVLMFQTHPAIGADMIRTIPRMENVAEIIRYQEKNYDGSGFPQNDIKEDMIPAGSRIIKIALDYDKGVSGGNEPEKVLAEMDKKTGTYDPLFLNTARKNFLKIEADKKMAGIKEITSEKLEDGMYLAEDLVASGGVIIGNSNQKITSTLIITIRNYIKNQQLRGTIKVFNIKR